MKIMNMTCGNCAGTGIIDQWLVVDTNTRTCQKKTTTCEACGGTGHTEYAVFEVEEAKAILKFCGLTTKS